MTVAELRDRLEELDLDLNVQVDAREKKLGELGMNAGRFDVKDVKIGAAFGFGRTVYIEV